jgi:hypothetical protein
VQLEELPKTERPSLSWYLQRHGFGDAAGRLSAGAWQVLVRFFFPEAKLPPSGFVWRPPAKKWEQPLAHRGIYLFLLAGLCGLLIASSRLRLRESMKRPGNFACVVLAAMLGIVYVLLYGWYWPIGRGDRFMGSLWIPCVFGLCWLAFELRRRAASRFGDAAYLGVPGLVLALLVLQIVGILWRFSHGIYLVTRN